MEEAGLAIEGLPLTSFEVRRLLLFSLIAFEGAFSGGSSMTLEDRSFLFDSSEERKLVISVSSSRSKISTLLEFFLFAVPLDIL